MEPLKGRSPEGHHPDCKHPGRKLDRSAPGSCLISMNFATVNMADHLAANPFFNSKVFHQDAFR